ncbi:MAG TPA: hypothetical protein VN628_10145 [Vicinamibacterales bacterium]|nr:hypothetical protein [Vicinamibacterales bacterium]
MKRRTVFVALLAGLACGGQLSSAQPLPPADVQRILVTYLECEECQSGELQAVVRLGDTAVAPLAQFLREGPPQSTLDPLRQHVIAQYQQDVEYRNLHSLAAPTMSADQTVALYAGNFSRMYRLRAVRALGAINSANAKAALMQAQAYNVGPDIKAAIAKALQ